jgi:superfamily II DNA/RNA helicase
VLDECDEMLNMGFVDDVEKILNAGVDVATVQVGRLLPKPLALLMGGMCLKRA